MFNLLFGTAQNTNSNQSKIGRRRNCKTFASSLLRIERLESRELLATLSWTGGAYDGLWSSIGNWSPQQRPAGGDTLGFHSAVYADVMNNDIGGSPVFKSVTFDADTSIVGAFAISGNTVNVQDNLSIGSLSSVIFYAALNVSGTLETGRKDLRFRGNATIGTVSGTYSGQHLFFGIGGSPTNFTVSNGSYAGAIGGVGSLIKTGPGTLRLSGAISADNPIYALGGTLEFAGSYSASFASSLYIYPGATASFTSFNPAIPGTVSRPNLDVNIFGGGILAVDNVDLTVGNIYGRDSNGNLSLYGATNIQNGAELTVKTVFLDSLTIGANCTAAIAYSSLGSLAMVNSLALTGTGSSVATLTADNSPIYFGTAHFLANGTITGTGSVVTSSSGTIFSVDTGYTGTITCGISGVSGILYKDGLGTLGCVDIHDTA
jgi:hypothetical protein